MEILLVVVSVLAGLALGWMIQAGKQKKQAEAEAGLQATLDETRRQLEAAKQAETNARHEKEKLILELGEKNSALNHLQERLQQQVEDVERVRKELNSSFEIMANKLFEEKKKSFSESNKEQMEGILSPLKDKLKSFEEKVEKTYDEEKSERIRLKKEIDDLVQLNKKLDEDARNLTTALKGDNKTQGNWGEMILEKILERSGLSEGIEYRTQHTSVNSEGEKIRPDIVVFLPEDKHLIIDSKVSMVAFNSMMAAESEQERERCQKLHIESVRSHVKLLSDKSYWTAAGLNTPDFVLLFMPIESAFSAAMQGDPELYQYAWDRQIVVVSPTTLLATLRTVSSIWKQEKRTRNAEAIAEEAGALYDKFVGFTEDLIDLGKKMKSSTSAYEEAMKKLSEGKGNLVNRAEKMRKLGAKQTKAMNPLLVDRASTDASEGAEKGE